MRTAASAVTTPAGRDASKDAIGMPFDTSRRIRECSRDVDILGRYGGEEFAVILPSCSPSESLVAGGCGTIGSPWIGCDDIASIALAADVFVLPSITR
mgnify:CR=1 FL=1